MATIDLVRSHVERCLQDSWDVCRVSVDDNGDYPFRNGTAACWVRVEPGTPPVVRVYAHAAYGLKRSAKLLAELNDVNTRTRTAHVLLAGDLAVVEHALLAESVDRASLEYACSAVATVAADIGDMLAAVYGGSTPYPVEDSTADA